MSVVMVAIRWTWQVGMEKRRRDRQDRPEVGHRRSTNTPHPDLISLLPSPIHPHPGQSIAPSLLLRLACTRHPARQSLGAPMQALHKGTDPDRSRWRSRLEHRTNPSFRRTSSTDATPVRIVPRRLCDSTIQPEAVRLLRPFLQSHVERFQQSDGQGQGSKTCRDGLVVTAILGDGFHHA